MRKSPIIIALVILVTLCTSAFAQTQSGNTAAPSGVVNINTADASQLAFLPYVGAKAAERILEYRKAHGSFAKVTDLMEVKGFGEKSFERLRQYVTVEGKTTLSAKVHTKSTRKSNSKKPSPAAS